MVLVKTKRRIGSAGYASVNVQKPRSGSTAAPLSSASHPLNLEAEKREYEKKLSQAQQSGEVVQTTKQSPSNFSGTASAVSSSQTQRVLAARSSQESQARVRRERSETALERIKRESGARYDPEKRRYVGGGGITRERAEEIIAEGQSDEVRRQLAIRTGNPNLLPKEKGTTYEEYNLRKKTSSPEYLRQRARRPEAIGTVTYVKKAEGTAAPAQPAPDPTAGIRQRIEALEARDEAFYNQPGFQRIRDTASVVTQPQNWVSGRYVPIEQRSKAGQTIEMATGALMAGPIAAGGFAASAGGKVAAFTEGLFYKETRKNIPGELWRGAKEVPKVYDVRKPEGVSTFIVAAVTAPTLMPQLRTSWPVRTGMKAIYPDKYVPIDKTGITFIEGHTVPRSLPELRGFEGRAARTIHTTDADIFGKQEKVMLISQQQSASKGRKELDLYNFYKSAPSKPTQDVLIKQTPPAATQYPKSVWEFVRSEGEPYAYMGYIGVMRDSLTSSQKSIPYKPVARLYIGDDTITPTPARVSTGTVEQVNKWQLQQSGKTLIPAENIAAGITEGQFISPAKYQGVRGYENTPGSILTKTGEAQFTYYTTTKQNPYTDPISRKLWDIFGRKKETYKVELQKVKTEPAEAARDPIAAKAAGIKTVRPELSPKLYSRVVNLKPVKPVFSRYTSSKSSSVKASSYVSGVTSSSKPSYESPSRIPSSGRGSSTPSSSTPTYSGGGSVPPSSGGGSSGGGYTGGGSGVPSSPAPSRYNQYRESTPRISTLPPSRLPFGFKYSTEKRGVSGFNVFVRRKKLFRKVNVKALSREEALSYGAFQVRGTAAATFKIEPAGVNVKKGIFRGPPARTETFLQKPGGLYIQKSKERISSLGEKREITFKGIAASRAKSKGKLFGLPGGKSKWAF